MKRFGPEIALQARVSVRVAVGEVHGILSMDGLEDEGQTVDTFRLPLTLIVAQIGAASSPELFARCLTFAFLLKFQRLRMFH